MRNWRMSKREASQPSTKATGSPSSSQLKSKSMLAYGGQVGGNDDGGRRGRRCGDRRQGRLGELGRRAAVLPPARQHAERADHHAAGEGGEHHEDQRGAPGSAEEEVDRGVLLVVQREGEEGKKNGCLEQQQEIFHAGPRWRGNSMPPAFR